MSDNKIEHRPLGYYNYTVVLTYVGMLSGFLGITSVMGGQIYMALICLMVAGVCDMFDGAVASTKERNCDEKCFGIQIDSLSDLICFGVLPATIVYRTNANPNVAFAISSLYLLCALIRLAYFNVDEQNRQSETSERREIYLGLPVTSIALILPCFWMLADLIPAKKPLIITLVLFLVAMLFIVPFQLKKPHKVGKIVMGSIGVVELVLLIVRMK